jgi:cell division protein FtsB
MTEQLLNNIIACLASMLAGLSLLLTIKTNNKAMATFEEQQEQINATNRALDNVQAEMTAQKKEIDDLKTQIGSMGLTAEQEAVIAEGLAAIRKRSEAISTVEEGGEVIEGEGGEA